MSRQPSRRPRECLRTFGGLAREGQSPEALAGAVAPDWGVNSIHVAMWMLVIALCSTGLLASTHLRSVPFAVGGGLSGFWRCHLLLLCLGLRGRLGCGSCKRWNMSSIIVCSLEQMYIKGRSDGRGGKEEKISPYLRQLMTLIFLHVHHVLFLVHHVLERLLSSDCELRSVFQCLKWSSDAAFLFPRAPFVNWWASPPKKWG